MGNSRHRQSHPQEGGEVKGSEVPAGEGRGSKVPAKKREGGSRVPADPTVESEGGRVDPTLCRRNYR